MDWSLQGPAEASQHLSYPYQLGSWNLARKLLPALCSWALQPQKRRVVLINLLTGLIWHGTSAMCIMSDHKFRHTWRCKLCTLHATTVAGIPIASHTSAAAQHESGPHSSPALRDVQMPGLQHTHAFTHTAGSYGGRPPDAVHPHILPAVMVGTLQMLNWNRPTP